jgi:S-adenosylmethionine:tRNA ribosyltransferase-isomerase
MRRLDAENGIPQKTARFQALGRASRPLRPGTLVEAAPLGSTGMEAQRVCVEVLERKAAGLLEVAVTGEPDVESALEMMGHMPLPPYLGRPDDEQDSLRYQTVFARKLGSVAAPTAGLHLSERLILRLKQRDVRVASLTLQIGMDTFRPIRTAEVDLHPMHTESFEVSAELASEVQAARNRGSRILAVGTTVVRALESARAPTNSGLIQPTRKDTQLFIRAGYRFSVVDGMLTNFHQPKSTLLALVCAFAGRERVLGAYAEAVTRSYRFLSYGDAMWIPDRID